MLAESLFCELLEHLHGRLAKCQICSRSVKKRTDLFFLSSRIGALLELDSLFWHLALVPILGCVSSCDPRQHKLSSHLSWRGSVTHIAWKLSPPPSNVDSSISNPSSPRSRNSLSFSRFTLFFSSCASLPTGLGPTMSSILSFASSLSRLRLYFRSSASCSAATSFAYVRSDDDGRVGPMTREPLGREDDGWGLGSRREAPPLASSLVSLELKPHLYEVLEEAGTAPTPL